MCVELGKILLHGHVADGKRECLIAIVPCAPVSLSENFCHGKLGHLLAIAEDAKLGLSHEDLFPAQEAGFPAFNGESKVGQDFLYPGLRIFCIEHLELAQYFVIEYEEQPLGSKKCIPAGLSTANVGHMPGPIARSEFRVPRRRPL